ARADDLEPAAAQGRVEGGPAVGYRQDAAALDPCVGDFSPRLHDDLAAVEDREPAERLAGGNRQGLTAADRVLHDRDDVPFRYDFGHRSGGGIDGPAECRIDVKDFVRFIGYQVVDRLDLNLQCVRPGDGKIVDILNCDSVTRRPGDGKIDEG